MSENDIHIEARNLHRVYTIGKASLHVLKDVSLQVRRGETLSIMGASGAADLAG